MKTRKLAAIASAAILALSLAACASERDNNPGGGATGGATGGAAGGSGTFVFGAAGAPVSFDPFYASDGETFRITRQLSDNLIEFEEGGAAPGPGLAESWESSASI